MGETMTNSLITKAFNGKEVRIVAIDSAHWFVAGDVAETLGYKSTQAITKLLDDDEYRSDHAERFGEITIISESGLYHAIFKSRRPESKAFRRWVTSEVLPSIRTTGEYVDHDLKAKLAESQARAFKLDRENMEMRIALSAGGADYERLRELQNLIFKGITERRSGLSGAEISQLATRNGHGESETMDALSHLYTRFVIKQDTAGNWVLAR